MATTTQTRKLYGDEVTLHFNPNSRNRYQLGDGSAPVGVTTVLNVLAKPALMLWPMNMALGYIKDHCSLMTEQVFSPGEIDKLLEEASKAHTKKSDKGKDVGSEVHKAIELQLKESLPHAHYDRLSHEAKKAVDAMADWIYEVKPNVLATEQIVYSREHNYAGTFDALLEIDGKIVLCDVKTSNASRTAPRGVYPENFLQLGAYSKAFTEDRRSEDEILQHLNVIDDLMIINAGKTGTLSTLRASELGLSVSDCESAWLNVLDIYKFMTPLSKQLKELV